MKLVENWKRAWRWHSIQLAGLLAILPLVWAELPADVKAMIPDAWTPYIVTLLAVGVIVGRLRPQ
jgi:hypothetical protein